jgi:hypothetical protein
MNMMKKKKKDILHMREIIAARGLDFERVGVRTHVASHERNGHLGGLAEWGHVRCEYVWLSDDR